MVSRRIAIGLGVLVLKARSNGGTPDHAETKFLRPLTASSSPRFIPPPATPLLASSFWLVMWPRVDHPRGYQCNQPSSRIFGLSCRYLRQRGTWATLALRIQPMSHRGGLRGCPPPQTPRTQPGLLLPRDTRGPSSSRSPARSHVCAAISLAALLRGKAHGICYLSLRWGGDRPEPWLRRGWGVLQPHSPGRRENARRGAAVSTGLAASGTESGVRPPPGRRHGRVGWARGSSPESSYHGWVSMWVIWVLRGRGAAMPRGGLPRSAWTSVFRTLRVPK